MHARAYVLWRGGVLGADNREYPLMLALAPTGAIVMALLCQLTCPTIYVMIRLLSSGLDCLHGWAVIVSSPWMALSRLLFPSHLALLVNFSTATSLVAMEIYQP